MFTGKPSRESGLLSGKPTKKLSQIDATVRVLADAKEPMNCVAMVDATTSVRDR